MPSIIKVFCLAVFLTGCDIAYDCPVDTPDCCYNVLTGCQLFDLPQGCSCSQYGFGLAATGKAAHISQYLSRTSTSKVGFSGSWSGTLRRSSSSCAGSLAKLSGVAIIKDRNGRISANIANYGIVKGKKTRQGFSASGTYSTLFSGCSALVNISFKSTGTNTADTNTSVIYSCPFAAASCQMRYHGSLRRQR